MSENNYQKFLDFNKKTLRRLRPRFSFHYVAYTTMFMIVVFSIIQLVSATTPNPGHPWSEVGDGVFTFTSGQTATNYTYTFPAANTAVLTTNSAVTVAQGGTGLTSIVAGSILAANSANTLTAVTSTSGTKVLTNTSGVITWETSSGSMVYPGSGIPNSTGSSWGTSYSTTGSGTVVALATTPTFTTNITTPLILGGSSTTQDLSFQTTSGVGATGADMHFLVGNNGGTEAMTILNNGNVGIGNVAPSEKLDINGNINIPTTTLTSGIIKQAGTNIFHTYGTQNLFTGYDTGNFTTTGQQNTAFGNQIMGSLTTGSYNTAVGMQALFIGNSSENAAFGRMALMYANDGNYNSALGNTALGELTSGDYNVGIGKDAGRTITTGSNNTFIGYIAGYNVSQLNNAINSMALGNGSYTTASNQVVIGNINITQTLLQGSVSVGLGMTSPTAALHIKAGTATAGTAPLKLTTGTNLSTTEAGAIEYDGTHLYFTATNGGTRYQLDQQSGGSMVYPGSGIPNSTGSSWGTSYSTTGSGTVLTLATTPTFTTNITTPLILGGSSTTQDLSFQTTSGVGATGADMHFLVGNNGGTEAMTILNNGNVGIGDVAPGAPFTILSSQDVDTFTLTNQSLSANIGFVLRLPLSTGVNDGKAFGFYAGSEGWTRGIFYSDGSYGIGPGNATRDVFFRRYSANNLMIDSNKAGGLANLLVTGKIGIGEISPTAALHLKAGTATAGTAPLKLTAGTNLSTTEAGAIEYDGTHLYFTATNGGTRYQLDQQSGSGGMSIGGTITGATQGSVLFAGASGVLAQNNDALYWNDSTSQLSVGGILTIEKQNMLQFNDTDDSNYVAFSAPTTVSSNVRWILPSADSSGCFKSDGSGNMSIDACGDTNEQLFASNGNYTKPDNALMAIVELWGGGGGGGSGYSGAVGTIRAGGAGGGGGAYNQSIVSASHLSSSVPVTVGASGTAGPTTLATGMDGGAGGRSCISSNSSCGGTIYASAFGGGGGNGGNGTAGSGGGGGGGSLSVGTTNGTQATGGTGGNPLGASAGAANSGAGGGGGATAAATGAAGGAAYFGGAGGGSSSSTGAGNSGAGGGSYKGGSGGGAGGSIATTYTRRNGGAGGASNNASGGGGTGGSSEGAAGGAGADGIMNGGSGGGGGSTGSAVVGGAGGAGGQRGGGGGGGGASNTTSVGAAGGAGGTGYVRVFTLRGAGADLAEVYGTFDDTLIAGEVVALDQKMKAGVRRTSKPYDSGAVGVVSTDPGLIIGSVEDKGAEPVLVALSGRVPVKVNLENGPIKKGDYLTPSSEPGVAMRATKAGTIIGQAMTEYTNEEDIGFIVAFIKSGPSNGVALNQILPGLSLDSTPTDGTNADTENSEEDTSDDDTSKDEDNVAEISNEETIQKIALQYFLANKMELAQATEISEIYTDRLSAALEVITPTVITDTLSTNSIVVSTGEVISFNSPAEFIIPPLFNSDTAGFALIKEGDRRVRVTYKESYIGEPVVSADLAFNVLDGISDIFAKDLFENNLKYMIIDSSQDGFAILINQEAPRDLRFSWTALSVKDPEVFESVVEGLIIEDIGEDNTDDESTIDTGDDNFSESDTTVNREEDQVDVITNNNESDGDVPQGNVPDIIDNDVISNNETISDPLPSTIYVQDVVNDIDSANMTDMAQ